MIEELDHVVPLTVLLSLGKWRWGGKPSGILFIPGLLPRGMEEPKEKLTPVGHKDATCLDFRHVPLHALPHVASGEFSPGRRVTKFFHVLGCMQHSLF